MVKKYVLNVDFLAQFACDKLTLEFNKFNFVSITYRNLKMINISLIGKNHPLIIVFPFHFNC